MAKPNQNSTVAEMRAYIKSKKLNHPLIRLGLKKAELQAGLKKLGHWEEKAKEKKTRKRLGKAQKEFLGGIDDKPKKAKPAPKKAKPAPKKAEPKKKDSVTYKGKKFEVAPAPKKAEPKKKTVVKNKKPKPAPKKPAIDKGLFLEGLAVMTEVAKGNWRGVAPKGYPPLPPPDSRFFYIPDGDEVELGFVGNDNDMEKILSGKYQDFFTKVMEAGDGISVEYLGDDDRSPLGIRVDTHEMAKRMKLSKEDTKKFISWVGRLTGVSMVKPTSYQEKAKQVFDDHKIFFGKNHYAQVEIKDIGTVNWDGYTLYEKGLSRRGDKIGTYQNEKHLDEWSGDSLAFSKYEPLELNQNAKGLRLTRIP